ncbi:MULTISPECIES: hypothetical protein [Saccharopolyspora]|uniref:Tripartite tricarboxylate transporter substrate binding protein n=1 Tax=Saccharopolyspora gregorii TaxID=33914 RepID=A0ABP6RKL8_9PSEU|nr:MULTISPECIES: hypothetical protein [Saccharopolyspora]MCA1186880.1 hypothetical protein [Saccharopolyspora sp. 6T]MCA1193357.1 hypothetical protein [Saccharopolyspora sp. 6V]MCA1228066.1 hypothetical protein [Saccharopolyspora sp. 6M]MCA1282102.1 hypothetical protein [Saccharopolyspora sp. 7B]
MSKSLARLTAATVTSLALLGLGAGVAQADPPSIWVIPGVDAGGLLSPTVGLPTAALNPVVGLLDALS